MLRCSIASLTHIVQYLYNFINSTITIEVLVHLSLLFINFFPKAQAYGSFTQPEKADKKYNNLLKSCYTPKNGLNKPSGHSLI